MKLPPVKSKDLLKALMKAGFKVSRKSGSHFRLVHPDGRKMIVAVHSGREVARGTLKAILRQSEISKEELLRFLK